MCRVITGLTLFGVVVTQVLSMAKFDFDLVTFRNDRGLLSNGSCCSGTTLDGFCPESCKTVFKLCLTNFQVDVNPRSPCTFGSEITETYSTNNIDFRSLPQWNLYKWPSAIDLQDLAWPGDFSFIITALQQTADSAELTIGTYTYAGRMNPGQSQSSWFNDTKGGSARLLVNWSLSCNDDYYGPQCNVPCKARDDDLGHFECGANGERICRQGWQGEYCDKAICLEGCSTEYGSCRQPNECSCTPGWKGRHCDECDTYPGCENGYCEIAFQCTCFPGWGGAYCNQDLNYCTHNTPCQNGATCTNTGEGSYTCTCPVGYSGTNCEVAESHCLSNTCLNGGRCEDVGNDYVCHCNLGYSGRQCQLNRTQLCTESTCMNGGTCERIGTDFRCRCMPGWTGRYCQHNVNECGSDPCLNGGQCIDKINEFYCQCPAGFSGTTCSVDQNECTTNPCKNGGQCIDKPGSYECSCPPGYYGALCELNVNDCAVRPCANGGSCTDRVNDFECICAPGWTGKWCNEQVNECASYPCMNGGTCVDNLGRFQCYCTAEFKGDRCQNSVGSASFPITTHKLSQHTARSSTEMSPPIAKQVISTPSSGEVELTRIQFILICVFGSAIPIILLLVCVSLLLYRRCNRRVVDQSIEDHQNNINSINNRAPTDKATKLENEYEVVKPSISFNYRNEASLPSKVIHKELLKDINNTNPHKSGNSSVTSPHKFHAASNQERSTAPLQFYQSSRDSIYRPSDPQYKFNCLSQVIHQPTDGDNQTSDVPSVSAQVTSQQHRPSYSLDEYNNMYLNRPYSVTDV